MPLGSISERAKALHAHALVWDNQACLSIEITDKFFSSLDRHKACGVDIVSLNVGFDAKPWEHDVLLTAYLRHWFLARPDDYVVVNPRSLWDHPRNVPDDLMRACAKSGGVMGITGSNRFLGDDDTTTETFLRHLDYAVQLIGPEHVGISSGYTFETDFMKIDVTEMSNSWPKGFGYESGIRFVEPEELPEGPAMKRVCVDGPMFDASSVHWG